MKTAEFNPHKYKYKYDPHLDCHVHSPPPPPPKIYSTQNFPKCGFANPFDFILCVQLDVGTCL